MSAITRRIGEPSGPLKQQFPIARQVSYCSLHHGKVLSTGTGKTLQISSREIQFMGSTRLQQGERVHLAVDWPALLDNRCLLKLEIWGSVIASRANVTEVRIAQHLFRTRGERLKVDP